MKIVYKQPNLLYSLGYASDNNHPLRKVDEATINRIVNKHNFDGYVIVSACRSRFYKDTEEEVPNDEIVADELLARGEQLNKINNRRTVELKQMIINDNHSFLPVYGGYKEIGSKNPSIYEKSFIIFNFNRRGEITSMDELYKDALKYGAKFNQDTVLIKKPNEKPYYVKTNKNIGDVDFVFDGDYTLNDLTQMYFTALKKFQKKNADGTFEDETSLTGKPQRFTFEGVYINPAPISVHEATRRHYLNELFDEEAVAKNLN